MRSTGTSARQTAAGDQGSASAPRSDQRAPPCTRRRFMPWRLYTANLQRRCYERIAASNGMPCSPCRHGPRDAARSTETTAPQSTIDRRWPETYRVMGLQGVEMILSGYSTPVHNPPSPEHDNLAHFHNALVMQAGAAWAAAASPCACARDRVNSMQAVRLSGRPLSQNCNAGASGSRL